MSSSDFGPFAHLTAPHALLYREVMRAFVAAKRRFVVHLRPEDIRDAVAYEGSQAREAELAAIVDALQKRALSAYDEQLGRRGSLQAVALADIAVQLRALRELAKAPDPDAGRVSLLLRGLVGRCEDLAANAQAFMGSLERTIDLYDADVEAFRAYKDRLVDYLERFIKDLVTVGGEIAGLLADLERDDVTHLLHIAARRDAEDAAPGAAAGSGDADDPRKAGYVVALRGWDERWRGLRQWFVSEAHQPSQAKLLRARARSAIPQLLAVVATLNERRAGRSDRSADFRALARWFAEAPDDAAMHRLWRVAFGVHGSRHLVVDRKTLDARGEEPVPRGARGAPPWSARGRDDDGPTARWRLRAAPFRVPC